MYRYLLKYGYKYHKHNYKQSVSPYLTCNLKRIWYDLNTHMYNYDIFDIIL